MNKDNTTKKQEQNKEEKKVKEEKKEEKKPKEFSITKTFHGPSYLSPYWGE